MEKENEIDMEYVDVDKKENKELWPTNLLLEVYGEYEFMKKGYREGLHKEIVKEKHIEEELDKF